MIKIRRRQLPDEPSIIINNEKDSHINCKWTADSKSLIKNTKTVLSSLLLILPPAVNSISPGLSLLLSLPFRLSTSQTVTASKNKASSTTSLPYLAKADFPQRRRSLCQSHHYPLNSQMAMLQVFAKDRIWFCRLYPLLGSSCS